MFSAKTLFTGALLAASVFASSAVAEETDSRWSTRLRATYLATVDHSSGVLGKDVLSVSDKLIPEFDIDYRLGDEWSLELVLTVPQEHDVNLKGVGEIGNFEHLPPTVFLQYHPQMGKVFRPYLGAGVNFTLIMDDDLLGGAAKLDNYSIGPAAQLGFDIRLADRWTLNFDLKRIMIRSDVKVGGVQVAEVRLDPWAYSVGFGYAF